MAFRYEYKTDEELELGYKLLAAGECKFMIKSVADKDDRGFELINSKGNPYLKIELVVIDSKGQKGLVMENISSNAAWKIKELCHAVGKPQYYNPNGEFEPSSLIGLQGRAMLQDREYTKRDGSVAMVTSIASYIPQEKAVQENVNKLAEIQPAAKVEFDDSIPF